MQVDVESEDEELVWREDHEEPLDVDAEEHHAPASPLQSGLRLRGGVGASEDAPAADADVVVLRLRGEGQEGVVAGDPLEREPGLNEDLRRLRSQGLRGGGGGGGGGEEWGRTSGAFGLRAEPSQEAPGAGHGGAAVEEGVRLRGDTMSAFTEVRQMGADLAEGR